MNTSPGCDWSTTDFSANCKFMTDMVAALKAKGKSTGIYASHYMWIKIMGSTSNCSIFKSFPLWYAHYDKTPSFSDWASLPFGGWFKPYIKQFEGTV